MVLRRPIAAVLLIPFLLAARSVAAQDSATPLRDSAARLLEDAQPVGDVNSSPSLGDFGDGRRTLGRFLPNLGRNIVGVFSRDNLRPLVAGALLTAAATPFDTDAQRLVRSRAEEFGEVGQQAGALSTVAPLTLGLFAAGRAASGTRFRAATYDLAQATLVSGLYTEALKRAVGRERPDGSNSLSFPSGHTSNAFAWATVASRHYGPKVGLPAYAAAGLIGISRIERDKHHLSDVVAGAVLGTIVGKTVVRKDGEPEGGRRLALVPMTDANGTGLGAGVHFEF